jgi:hypothetical protein
MELGYVFSRCFALSKSIRIDEIRYDLTKNDPRKRLYGDVVELFLTL